MTAEPAHHWPVPPQDGYTVDDLLTLPDLPPHTELIDGSLVFVSPQRYFHSLVIDLLVNGLRRTAPPELRVVREMTVVIDKRNGPEPDVSVVGAASVGGWEQTYFPAEAVLLAVEVVSPDSEARDRMTKPFKYACAGIPHFWRVDMTTADHQPIVHVFKLDNETRSYAPTGTHRGALKLTVPFDIDIDLTEIRL
ncbi:Uma2 family endonuclease [Streptomyces sp. NRRL B-1677]|uniref:Uma2 family endonuclease n=1 Tax=Streptomyces klenkii TaxID=1420899 RepID=A0A3B0BDZ3_9ACTN|nr:MULTISPECIES: Uma2 family endonuclease [Streptomyces]MBF6044302.1 Uma2 family endonuclease [Streptomyces sp. NRRL B-1677]RKN70277.1 Uma2 family endonuclease [Streptomyces klenkii]